MIQTPTISNYVASSQYQAVADDALNDEDNAAWVMTLEYQTRAEWIERIRWIRLIDRLAEDEMLNANHSQFQQFQHNWNQLLRGTMVEPGCPHQDVLLRMQACWFNQASELYNNTQIQAWSHYLQAIAHYHTTKFTITTLQDYETMALGLSGSFFQVFPYITLHYQPSVAYLGVVDQFFNNLRDLQEDAQQGICYLPKSLLDHFGVKVEEVLDFSACDHRGYHKMMQFWLGNYLPKINQNLTSLVAAEDLHPSWKLCRDWCLHRYHRIERVFCECNFDYTLFPSCYWSQVQQELPKLIYAAQQSQYGVMLERQSSKRY